MKHLVYQAQEKGCGFATVKMALIHMSHDPRYAFLPEPHVVSGPDLATLISYAEEAGLHLRGYHAEPVDLLVHAEFPLLVLLREEGKLHMAFLYKWKRSHYVLLDPAKGKRILSKQELSSLLSGDFLRIEGYEKKGDVLLWDWRQGRLEPRVRLAQIAFAFLPIVFLGAGLWSLDHGLHPLIVLSCLGLTVLSSLGEKALLLRAMERFDNRHMDGIDAKDLKRRRDLYVHYHAYKRAAFVGLGEVLGRFASTFAALAFFLLHDLYLALASSIGVAALALLEFLLKDKRRYLEGKAESCEGSYLFALVNKPRREELRNDVSRASKSYARVLFLQQTAAFALSLALAGGFSLLGGAFSTLRLVFYLLTLTYVLFEAQKLFHSGSLLEARQREEPYFLLNIVQPPLVPIGKQKGR